MIRHIRVNKLKFMFFAFLFMVSNSEANMKSNDIWGFITDIKVPTLNLTVQNVNSFPVALRLIKTNEYTHFYQATSFELKDGSTVSDIDVRLSKDRNDHGPFLSFTWSGQCISLDTVKKHYPELRLTDVPRGRSENEVTSHTTPADKQGQEITFSFAETQPDCLHRVIISSQK
jgi:hypothetical protein